MFNRHDALDLDHLAPIASTDLVPIIDDPAMGLDLVRVLALLDGVVEQAKLELVIDVASALHVHAEFVDAIQQLVRDHVYWVADDTIRANVATIPGLPWLPHDPYGPFMPYAGDALDPTLTGRYERLTDLDDSTFGRAFHDHYQRNGYAFPGAENAIAEVWATAHDSLQVLSGYSTSAQGELLVAAFTGGALRPGTDFMESHILPTILIYHLGIDINKGLNAGDRARMQADPSWRDNYDGNVHLGLDAEKLWVAWDGGRDVRGPVLGPLGLLVAHRRAARRPARAVLDPAARPALCRGRGRARRARRLRTPGRGIPAQALVRPHRRSPSRRRQELSACIEPDIWVQ